MRTDIFSFHSASGDDCLIEVHTSNRTAKKLGKGDVDDETQDLAQKMAKTALSLQLQEGGERVKRVVVSQDWKQVQLIDAKGNKVTRRFKDMQKALQNGQSPQAKQSMNRPVKDLLLQKQLLEQTDQIARIASTADTKEGRLVRGSFIERGFRPVTRTEKLWRFFSVVKRFITRAAAKEKKAIGSFEFAQHFFASPAARKELMSEEVRSSTVISRLADFFEHAEIGADDVPRLRQCAKWAKSIENLRGKKQKNQRKQYGKIAEEMHKAVEKLKQNESVLIPYSAYTSDKMGLRTDSMRMLRMTCTQEGTYQVEFIDEQRGEAFEGLKTDDLSLDDFFKPLVDIQLSASFAENPEDFKAKLTSAAVRLGISHPKLAMRLAMGRVPREQRHLAAAVLKHMSVQGLVNPLLMAERTDLSARAMQTEIFDPTFAGIEGEIPGGVLEFNPSLTSGRRAVDSLLPLVAKEEQAKVEAASLFQFYYLYEECLPDDPATMKVMEAGLKRVSELHADLEITDPKTIEMLRVIRTRIDTAKAQIHHRTVDLDQRVRKAQFSESYAMTIPGTSHDLASVRKEATAQGRVGTLGALPPEDPVIAAGRLAAERHNTPELERNTRFVTAQQTIEQTRKELAVLAKALKQADEWHPEVFERNMQKAYAALEKNALGLKELQKPSEILRRFKEIQEELLYPKISYGRLEELKLKFKEMIDVLSKAVEVQRTADVEEIDAALASREEEILAGLDRDIQAEKGVIKQRLDVLEGKIDGSQETGGNHKKRSKVALGEVRRILELETLPENLGRLKTNLGELRLCLKNLEFESKKKSMVSDVLDLIKNHVNKLILLDRTQQSFKGYLDLHNPIDLDQLTNRKITLLQPAKEGSGNDDLVYDLAPKQPNLALPSDVLDQFEYLASRKRDQSSFRNVLKQIKSQPEKYAEALFERPTTGQLDKPGLAEHARAKLVEVETQIQQMKDRDLIDEGQKAQLDALVSEVKTEIEETQVNPLATRKTILGLADRLEAKWEALHTGLQEIMESRGAQLEEVDANRLSALAERIQDCVERFRKPLGSADQLLLRHEITAVMEEFPVTNLHLSGSFWELNREWKGNVDALSELIELAYPEGSQLPAAILQRAVVVAIQYRAGRNRKQLTKALLNAQNLLTDPYLRFASPIQQRQHMAVLKLAGKLRTEADMSARLKEDGRFKKPKKPKKSKEKDVQVEAGLKIEVFESMVPMPEVEPLGKGRGQPEPSEGASTLYDRESQKLLSDYLVVREETHPRLEAKDYLGMTAEEYYKVMSTEGAASGRGLQELLLMCCRPRTFVHLDNKTEGLYLQLRRVIENRMLKSGHLADLVADPQTRDSLLAALTEAMTNTSTERPRAYVTLATIKAMVLSSIRENHYADANTGEYDRRTAELQALRDAVGIQIGDDNESFVAARLHLHTLRIKLAAIAVDQRNPQPFNPDQLQPLLDSWIAYGSGADRLGYTDKVEQAQITDFFYGQILPAWNGLEDGAKQELLKNILRERGFAVPDSFDVDGEVYSFDVDGEPWSFNILRGELLADGKPVGVGVDMPPQLWRDFPLRQAGMTVITVDPVPSTRVYQFTVSGLSGTFQGELTDEGPRYSVQLEKGGDWYQYTPTVLKEAKIKEETEVEKEPTDVEEGGKRNIFRRIANKWKSMTAPIRAVKEAASEAIEGVRSGVREAGEQLAERAGIGPKKPERTVPRDLIGGGMWISKSRHSRAVTIGEGGAVTARLALKHRKVGQGDDAHFESRVSSVTTKTTGDTTLYLVNNPASQLYQHLSGLTHRNNIKLWADSQGTVQKVELLDPKMSFERDPSTGRMMSSDIDGFYISPDQSIPVGDFRQDWKNYLVLQKGDQRQVIMRQSNIMLDTVLSSRGLQSRLEMESTSVPHAARYIAVDLERHPEQGWAIKANTAQANLYLAMAALQSDNFDNAAQYLRDAARSSPLTGAEEELVWALFDYQGARSPRKEGDLDTMGVNSLMRAQELASAIEGANALVKLVDAMRQVQPTDPSIAATKLIALAAMLEQNVEDQVEGSGNRERLLADIAQIESEALRQEILDTVQGRPNHGLARLLKTKIEQVGDRRLRARLERDLHELAGSSLRERVLGGISADQVREWLQVANQPTIIGIPLEGTGADVRLTPEELQRIAIFFPDAVEPQSLLSSAMPSSIAKVLADTARDAAVVGRREVADPIQVESSSVGGYAPRAEGGFVDRLCRSRQTTSKEKVLTFYGGKYVIRHFKEMYEQIDALAVDNLATRENNRQVLGKIIRKLSRFKDTNPGRRTAIDFLLQMARAKYHADPTDDLAKVGGIRLIAAKVEVKRVQGELQADIQSMKSHIQELLGGVAELDMTRIGLPLGAVVAQLPGDDREPVSPPSETKTALTQVEQVKMRAVLAGLEQIDAEMAAELPDLAQLQKHIQKLQQEVQTHARSAAKIAKTVKKQWSSRKETDGWNLDDGAKFVTTPAQFLIEKVQDLRKRFAVLDMPAGGRLRGRNKQTQINMARFLNAHGGVTYTLRPTAEEVFVDVSDLEGAIVVTEERDTTVLEAERQTIQELESRIANPSGKGDQLKAQYELIKLEHNLEEETVEGYNADNVPFFDALDAEQFVEYHELMDRFEALASGEDERVVASQTALEQAKALIENPRFHAITNPLGDLKRMMEAMLEIKVHGTMEIESAKLLRKIVQRDEGAQELQGAGIEVTDGSDVMQIKETLGALAPSAIDQQQADTPQQAMYHGTELMVKQMRTARREQGAVVKQLRADILALANTVPEGHVDSLRRLAGEQQELTVEAVFTAYAKGEMVERLQRVNPHLTEKNIAQLQDMVTKHHIEATKLQTLERQSGCVDRMYMLQDHFVALSTTKKIPQILGRFNKCVLQFADKKIKRSKAIAGAKALLAELETGGNWTQQLTSSYTSQQFIDDVREYFSQLESFLKIGDTQRYYDPTVDHPNVRAALAYEYTLGVVFRKHQVAEFMERVGTPAIVSWQGTGFGKTFMAPGLAKMITNGRNLVCVIDTKDLIPTTSKTRDKDSRAVYAQAAYRFNFTRDADRTVESLQQMKFRLLDAIANEGYIVTSKESIGSLVLQLLTWQRMAVDGKTDKYDEHIALAQEIVTLFRTRGVALADEIHQILNIIEALDYSEGDPSSLIEFRDFINGSSAISRALYPDPIREGSGTYAERSAQVAAKLRIHLNDQASVSQETIGEAMHDLAELVVDQALDEAYLPKDPLHELIARLVNDEGLAKRDLVAYLVLQEGAEISTTPPQIGALRDASEQKLLGAFKEQLGSTFMQVMQKVAGEDFGVHPDTGLTICPYDQGRAQPNKEFDDVFQTIQTHYMWYAANGIPKEGLRRVLNQWRMQLEGEMIEFGEPQDCPIFKRYQRIFGDEATPLHELKDSAIDKMAAGSVKQPEVQRRFLEDVVFPKIRVYPDKVSYDSMRLARDFDQFGGFSGTIQTRGSFSTAVSNKDDPTIDAAAAENFEKVYHNSANQQQFVLKNLEGSGKVPKLSEQLKAGGVDFRQYHSVVDAGGLFKELSAMEIAQDILDVRRDLDAVLIYNDDSELVILRRGSNKLEPFDSKTTPPELDRRFTFFRQPQLTGADNPMHQHAKALVTVSVKTRWGDFEQAVGRLRKNKEGQTYAVLYRESITEGIQQQLQEVEAKLRETPDDPKLLMEKARLKGSTLGTQQIRHLRHAIIESRRGVEVRMEQAEFVMQLAEDAVATAATPEQRDTAEAELKAAEKAFSRLDAEYSKLTAQVKWLESLRDSRVEGEILDVRALTQHNEQNEIKLRRYYAAVSEMDAIVKQAVGKLLCMPGDAWKHVFTRFRGILIESSLPTGVGLLSIKVPRKPAEMLAEHRERLDALLTDALADLGEIELLQQAKGDLAAYKIPDEDEMPDTVLGTQAAGTRSVEAERQAEAERSVEAERDIEAESTSESEVLKMRENISSKAIGDPEASWNKWKVGGLLDLAKRDSTQELGKINDGAEIIPVCGHVFHLLGHLSRGGGRPPFKTKDVSTLFDGLSVTRNMVQRRQEQEAGSISHRLLSRGQKSARTVAEISYVDEHGKRVFHQILLDVRDKEHFSSKMAQVKNILTPEVLAQAEGHEFLGRVPSLKLGDGNAGLVLGLDRDQMDLLTEVFGQKTPLKTLFSMSIRMNTEGRYTAAWGALGITNKGEDKVANERALRITVRKKLLMGEQDFTVKEAQVLEQVLAHECMGFGDYGEIEEKITDLIASLSPTLEGGLKEVLEFVKGVFSNPREVRDVSVSYQALREEIKRRLPAGEQDPRMDKILEYLQLLADMKKRHVTDYSEMPPQTRDGAVERLADIMQLYRHAATVNSEAGSVDVSGSKVAKVINKIYKRVKPAEEAQAA